MNGINVLLFLGSGVSFESGLPGVVKLTEDVLAFPNDSKSVPNGNHEVDKEFSSSDGQIGKLLRLLQSLDKHYLESVGVGYFNGAYRASGAIYRSETSYEDLIYMVQRIALAGQGLLDDALAGAFADLVEQKAGELLEGTSREARAMRLAILAQAASQYIQAHVGRSLHTETISGLDLVASLAQSDLIKKLDIVTLNHDTLVERLLANNKIVFVDGFSSPDGNVRWHDDSTYDNVGAKVRVIKPHGSVNWYEFQRHGLAWHAISNSAAPLDAIDGSGQKLVPYRQTPSFLAAANKTAYYNIGIYSDMFYRFHHALKNCHIVIMSGYGWADTGVSRKFDNWLDYNRNNRLILLHTDPDLLSSRSLIFASGYDGWVKSGQLVPILKWLSNTTIDELTPHLTHDGT